MTAIPRQVVPSLPFPLTAIEEDGNQPKERSAEKVRQEISVLEDEIQQRRHTIAASSRTSQKGIPGIDLNKLVANGSGKAIEEAEKKLATLNAELEAINSNAEKVLG
jgi:hypothetical protein